MASQQAGDLGVLDAVRNRGSHVQTIPCAAVIAVRERLYLHRGMSDYGTQAIDAMFAW